METYRNVIKEEVVVEEGVDPTVVVFDILRMLEKLDDDEVYRVLCAVCAYHNGYYSRHDENE